MTQPPTRKHVSWRVGEQPEHEKINRWIDAQSNIQISLANVVLHMIDRFGYTNITDHGIQKTLYQEPLLIQLQQPQQLSVTESEPIGPAEQQKQMINQDSTSTVKPTISTPSKSDSDEELYQNLDPGQF